MVVLQENKVKFNNNLIASDDGGRLSSDSGLVLIDELMDAFQFTQLSESIVTFKDFSFFKKIIVAREKCA